MNSMQQKVKTFNEMAFAGGRKTTAESRMLDVISELGELSKEVLKATSYGENSFKATRDFELEFGDCLYSLLALANESGIDAEKAVDAVLNKYASRIAAKDEMGSGR